MRLTRPLAGLLFVAAGIVACGGETTPPPTPVPTTLQLSTENVSFNALGATQQVSVTILDQNDQPIAGLTATFVSDDPGVASVSTTGLITAEGNGGTTVTVSHATLSRQVTVNVSQVVTQLAKTAGDQQMGQVATQLATAVEVELRDAGGSPVPGGVVPNATVQFVAAGGGAPVDLQVTANASGRASATWTLGTSAGSQQLNVSLVGGSATAQFTATAQPGPANGLIIVSGNNQNGAADQPLPDSIVVQIVDQFDNLTSGPPILFEVTSGGGSVSPDSVDPNASGRAATQWTLGLAVGAQTMEASGTGLVSGSPAAFAATAVVGVATTLVKVDGDAQTGLVGAPVNIRPAVRVDDQFGTAMSGQQVTFTVTGGGGSTPVGPVTTDANGVARVSEWTLGGGAGANTLDAASGALTPVTFSATGISAQFNLEVRFFGSNVPTAGQQAAFAAAEAVWENAIIGDLAAVPINQPQGQACSGGPADLPAINETVDDIVIFAKVDSIDGPDGVLGQARPCLIRVSNALPVVGLMFFDKDDLAALEGAGLLGQVIEHEMAHALGFGTLWNQSPLSLRVGTCPSPVGCTTDPHFVGPRAIAAFDEIGGTAYTASQKVPVEDCVVAPAGCSTGTVNGHWREAVFNTELMTGYITGSGPLSAMTIASFLDMGYQVNYSADDPYTWPAPPSPALRAAGTLVVLKDDIVWGPIQVVDESGRVVRVIRP